MPHVKKIIMQGFKSFARKTEIPFEEGMNVIVGPNGSGKSNITDALCFVLGRVSIKSIRAAKAANLIFSGNKQFKSSLEASVELIFDNSDKTFAIDKNEISIKRVVRKSGQSVYKINNETKTRQELLELLAQGGIDPHGFNIVLQGEIASLIKINADERRKIIEEVAGISIYETRKIKSLKELEKTEEKLKEVSTILKEKNSYLKNLEKERQEVLSYQKLEETIKKCEGTILDNEIRTKKKELKEKEEKEEKELRKLKEIKEKVANKNEIINQFEEKIIKINKKIQTSTSQEQETINKDLSELKAKLAGLSVKKENFERRLEQNNEKEKNMRNKIESYTEKLSQMEKSTPEIKQQQQELKKIQDRFDKLEKERRKFYQIKSEVSTLENQKEEKMEKLIEEKTELELIEKTITQLFNEIKYEKSPEKAKNLILETKKEIRKTIEEIETLTDKILELEKTNAIVEQTISREEKLKGDIITLKTCPLCKNEITKEHIEQVINRANEIIIKTKEGKEKNNEIKEKAKIKIKKLKEILEKLELKIREIELDIIKIEKSEEKKEQIKKLMISRDHNKTIIDGLNLRYKDIKKEYERLKNIEEIYDETRIRMQELSFSDIDMDSEISMKQMELEKIKIEIKAIERDSEDSKIELKKIIKDLEEILIKSKKKEKEQEEIYKQFQKLFEEKNEFQDQQKGIETMVIGFQHEMKNHEINIGNLNIEKAKLNAQLETLSNELEKYKGIEFMKGPIIQIKEKLNKAKLRFSSFGNINLRALEVYEQVKKNCELIENKVLTIRGEEEKILKIISEIDKKKKKAFITTLDAVNEYFTRNFSQLSKKGEVFLELENKHEPFEGGLNILLKVGRGKYFDVSSLSGGEKTLVALSLIFAIQEYKPYCFYIFDEIDAALDKHNAELLAALIRKYMTSGQYIIISHNDALITEASALYGVSMQENISKVISLKV